MQELWQQGLNYLGHETWIMQVFIIILVALIGDFVQRRLLRKLQKKALVTSNLWDDAIMHALIRPVSLLIWVLGISLAAEIASQQNEMSLLKATSSVRDIGIIVSITWFLLRLSRGVEKNIVEYNRKKNSQIDQTTIDAIAKLIRISIVITAGLVVLQNLGVSISGVLAFGGVGGLAVGLAAKDLLANFFGGLTVYLDRPFSVGDWISSPDKSIEGTVEYIGWRQTRIRKFDKRPIYVPNAAFTSLTVENPSRMSHRRIYETIGIRYGDIKHMDAITVKVEDMLQNHPEIDQSQTLMVQFNAFSPSSIDFFIYTFTRTVNWQHFHKVKQDVLLKIADIIEQHGAEIAYPTSTVHLASPQFAGIQPSLETTQETK
ncbi:MAG: mechanosensitive ion channel family protein [bacterium]